MAAPVTILRGNITPKVRPAPGQPLPFALIDFFKRR